MASPFQKVNKNWLLLGVAVALGIGAVVLTNRVIQQRISQLEEDAKKGNETVKVIVAKRDMARGETITADAMAVRAIPKQYLNKDAVLPDQFASMARQRLAIPLHRGDVLLPMHSEGNGSQVFSATLKKGLRALTFEVDTVNSISGMLRPGDRIDLIYTARASTGSAQEGDVTAPLLSNVSVLATDQTLTRRDEETGKDRSFSTVTLEVSPFDADRIIVAKSSGRLTAVLRHPDDEDPNGTKPLTAAQIASLGGRGPTGPLVEYIVGGSGGPADIKTQLGKLATSSANPVAAAAR